MSRFRILLVFGAIGLGVYAYQETRLGSKARAEPQRLSLARLAADGPGDNAHILLTDYLMCSWSFVYSSKRGSWTEAWVPAVELEGEYHIQVRALIAEKGEDAKPSPPRDLKVIVKLPSARTIADVERIAALDEVRGMIINEIEELGSQERTILERNYPGVDFARCWVFEEGRSPASSGKKFGLWGGALACLVLAFFPLLRRLARGSSREPLAMDPGSGEFK
ncbi:MAG: hypothetical protein ACT4PV_06750 [Planctomycetaceae bacterium]